ncbi:hypothetical protein [Halalkalibacter hemicellulosilyticus]|uniref:PTS ascorbate transporter subunit IIC n=1 Tax=Halalkalibacter hemicellulosilyticusJCM 9152 TaxID=1236971 RepID=W4QLA2_9BACI|nr:hypothetical protein [Halalkalibacter hemicellulosilyticus]GAE32866.1 hypothetical protein JCM9152_4456 [Halalkalibacter hemicellulosilyticusJCM 9152]
MQDLSGVWDWSFFWNVLGFILQSISPFVMLFVALISAGLLIALIVQAIRNRQ